MSNGLCGCGCGQTPPLATLTRKGRGEFAGKVRPFVPGHGARRDPMPRFEGKVDRSTECWVWLGSKNALGYGHISINGRKLYVHRWAYEQFVGPIPDGLQLDHLCRNTSCCNPDHLEPVPQRVNFLRGVHPSATAVRTNVCKWGHEFDEANTYYRKDRRGRQCRKCRIIRRAQYRLRKRAAA